MYRARDPRLKREVAIKILPPGVVDDVEKQKRFEREAQAASALNHPNILTIHDIGSDDSCRYIVSELIDGEPLRKLIQRGPVLPKKLLDIAVQISSGLAAAHRAGIVHRDLKPENIMLTADNHVKILDFGLAKSTLQENAIAEADTVSRSLTETGVIHGTAAYMSPEQASGQTIDHRSDQFSLGLILYELATGKRAFDRPTLAQILSAIISEDPPPLTSAAPNLPAPLRWILERCLFKEPSQRYDSTADLHRDLRTIQVHLSETMSAEMMAEAKPTSARRIILLIALSVGLLVAATMAALYTGKRIGFSQRSQAPIHKMPRSQRIIA